MSAEKARRAKQSDLDSGKVKPEKLDRITLEQFKVIYIERRSGGDSSAHRRRGKFPKLSASTIARHDMALRRMIKYFGATRPIAAIRTFEADGFIDAFEAGKLDCRKRKNKRGKKTGHKKGKQYTPPSEETVRGTIRDCKAILTWAKAFGMITENPWSDHDGSSLPTSAKRYVTVKEIDKVLAAAPDQGWKCLWALCRYAGLRLSEAAGLVWSGVDTDSRHVEHKIGVDFEAKKIRLVGATKKIRRYREVPIRPELMKILTETLDKAPEGQVSVCGGAGRHNQTRKLQKAIQDAGMIPWAKAYNALRSSAEQDFKTAGVPEPTYCKWIGHSAEVSRDHYVDPTPAEFVKITG